MKILLTILAFALLAIIALSLSGCVTDAEGNSRFDADSFNKATTTVLDTYERVNRYPDRPVAPYGSQYPVYAPAGYP